MFIPVVNESLHIDEDKGGLIDGRYPIKIEEKTINPQGTDFFNEEGDEYSGDF